VAWPSFQRRRVCLQGLGTMLYALLQKKDRATRRAIAQAISQHDSQAIQPFVVGSLIVHVMNAATATGPLFCIYCLDRVLPTKANPPKGRQASNKWHFRHATINDCIGEIRAPLGVLNPDRHGCYVALGCETVKGRKRKSCQTINHQGRTYCHLGVTFVCV